MAVRGRKRRLPQRLWAKLYEDFYPQMERYFVRHLRGCADAEDLAMQVFEELAYGQVPRDPEPYLRAMARNMLSRYRRNKAKESAGLRKLLAEAAATGGTGNLPRSQASYRETLEAIAATLLGRQLELIRLRFADNFSIQKIAARLGCSQPAVYKRIQRIRRRVSPDSPSR